MKIRSQVLAMEDELRRVRRDLHKIPEPAWTEKKTSAYICSYLKELSPDQLEILCGTGVRAVFMARHPQKTVAFRADIDALPVNECNEGIDYLSTHPGAMHACGHDGHMSTMLCLAKLVCENRESLQYNVVFLFQPAEEADGGARPLMEAGALTHPDVDEIYGQHLWPYLPAGKIGIKAGPLMSNMCDVNIRITGRGAHGARPQNGVDALVAAASFLSQAQTIVSRNMDPVETAVVTFGKISGGEARNVICGSVEIEGTVRTFDQKRAEYIMERLKEMLRGLEVSMGVKTEIEVEIAYPPVVNPKELVERAVEKIGRGDETLVPAEEVMIAEDFACYQEKIPGLFVFLGIQDAEHGESLHSSRFNFDEKNLLVGLEFMARMIDLP